MKPKFTFIVFLVVISFTVISYVVYISLKIDRDMDKAHQKMENSFDMSRQSDSFRNDSSFFVDEKPLAHEGKIIRRFHEMEEDFMRAHKNISVKNDELMTVLGVKLARANWVRSVSDSFRVSIEYQKKILEKQTSGFSKNVLDNICLNIKKTGENMLAQIENNEERNSISRKSDFINIDSEVIQNSMNNIPLAAVMTMLTKIQNDCLILESEILQSLAKSID